MSNRFIKVFYTDFLILIWLFPTTERIYEKEFANKTTGHANATTRPNVTKNFNITDLKNLVFDKRNSVGKNGN